jgi:hypothetical protein
MKAKVAFAIFVVAFCTASRPWGPSDVGNFVFSAQRHSPLELFPPAPPKRFETLKAQADWPLASSTCQELRHGKFLQGDLSGDGVNDFVFLTYCGGEELFTYVWFVQATKAHFAGVLTGKSPRAFRLKDSGPYQVLTDAGWCCVSYVGSANAYEVANSASPTFILSKRVMVFNILQTPSERMPPIRFRVVAPVAELRSEPRQYDVLDRGMIDMKGNVMAEFTAGGRGEAIAKHQAKNGNIWWFVLMDADSPTSASHFYDDKNSLKAGWIDAHKLAAAK